MSRHRPLVMFTTQPPVKRWRIASLAVVAGALAAACSGSTASPAASPSASKTPVIQNGAQILQSTFVAIVKRIAPSVVQIQDSQGLGSGIVFDSSGDIVTNAHVVARSTTFTVTFSDGRQETASLVGSCTPNDVAVVRIASSNRTIVPAAFGDSSSIEVGDIVFAVGNPLGLRSSVTDGIVSALREAVPESNGAVLPRVIQTSAAINPGNSGGALVNIYGEVVGIPTLGASDPREGSAAQGIGFAVPSNDVRQIVAHIVAGAVTSTSGGTSSC